MTHPMTSPNATAPVGHVTKRDLEPITITVPMPPTNTNSGAGRSRHWRSMEREKKSYWTSLDERQECGLIPAPPVSPLQCVTVRSSMVLRGAMDDDNAAARHKWLLDWLVSRGYIASDRRVHCRWEAFPEQRVTRSEPARITLTITPTLTGAKK